MSDDKYLRMSEVKRLVGLSRASIYNMMKVGAFPSQTKLGERAVAWLASEISEWMISRKNVVKTARESKPGRPPRPKRSDETPNTASPPIPSAEEVEPPSRPLYRLSEPAPTTQGDSATSFLWSKEGVTNRRREPEVTIDQKRRITIDMRKRVKPTSRDVPTKKPK